MQVIANIPVNGHDVKVTIESLESLTQPQIDQRLKDIVAHVKAVEANPTPEKRYNEWLR